jgi:hypothetical protein
MTIEKDPLRHFRLPEQIQPFPMNKPSPELMASCLVALMQNPDMIKWVREHEFNPGEGGAIGLWTRLAREYAEALQNEHDR